MITSKIYIASFPTLLQAFNCRGKKKYWMLSTFCCLSFFISHIIGPLLHQCSEEIRGEILFVLYKVSILQRTSAEGDGIDTLISFCPKLLYLLGDALMKTQNDDVRLNCVGLLLISHSYFC